MYIFYLSFRKALTWMIIFLLVVTAGFITYTNLKDNLTVTTTGSIEPIYQGNPKDKKIALTCNVFWGEEFLPDMLKILEKEGVKVTFFMGGQWVEKYPKLTKELAVRGHELGNHSYSHPHPTKISKGQNISEIQKTEDLVKEASKIKTKLYAPPYGEFDNTVLEAANEIGYTTILWSIDTVDWQRPAPEVITNRVLKKAHNGAIVLMHPTAPTAKALPEMIKQLKEQGYDFVTVSELIKDRGKGLESSKE